MLDEDQFDAIDNPEIKRVVQQLANLLEKSLAENDELRAEVQRLRDENNRLKGEQGKPDIKPSKPAPKETSDHSSEKKRQKPATWKKDTKNDKIVVNRIQRLETSEMKMPDDVQFKGYNTVTIQNIKIVTDNVLFKIPKYYSPSTKKTYSPPLPKGYEGGFGPDLRALVLTLHHVGNVTQKSLLLFLTHAGIKISAGQISAFLTEKQELFHEEKIAIGHAGLAAAPWVQTDDTATRVNGVNQHCHVLVNPLFSLYTTLMKKDRLSVLRVLLNGSPLSFLLTQELLSSACVSNLPQKSQKALEMWPLNTSLSETEVADLLKTTMPTLAQQSKKNLLDRMAVAGYHSQTLTPVMSLLVSDDAPQFSAITDESGLCWVHDGRHYGKLTPRVPLHRTILEKFEDKYWKYYDRLLDYKKKPSLRMRKVLEKAFDTLFQAKSGYDQLDFRIRQTADNKKELLQVLIHPEIPLHNNASELAVRRRVRKRDASFGPRSEAGIKAWDTFQTLLGTASKLDVSFIDYIMDRVSGLYKMPSLASVITQRASELKLGDSWN